MHSVRPASASARIATSQPRVTTALQSKHPREHDRDVAVPEYRAQCTVTTVRALPLVRAITCSLGSAMSIEHPATFAMRRRSGVSGSTPRYACTMSRVLRYPWSKSASTVRGEVETALWGRGHLHETGLGDWRSNPGAHLWSLARRLTRSRLPLLTSLKYVWEPVPDSVLLFHSQRAGADSAASCGIHTRACGCGIVHCSQVNQLAPAALLHADRRDEWIFGPG